MEVPIHLEGELTNGLHRMMVEAARLVDTKVTYVRALPDNPQAINIYEGRLDLGNPALILASEIRAIIEPVVNPFPNADPAKVMYLDIETHNEGRQWGMKPSEFFRLGQWAWGIDGPVNKTTDYFEFMEQVASAEALVAHNGHNFDFSVLYGTDSITPLLLAKEGRLLDTFVWANLAFPAPEKFTTRSGATFHASKPGEFMRWLSLDNLAFQMGVPGKLGDLKALAKKYQPPKTLVEDYDYGLIPLDDPEFLAYADQDVIALQQVTRKLTLMSPMSEYDWREQTLAAIDAQNTRNGFLVDVEAVTARRDTLRARKDAIVEMLVEKYDFPTEGKSPWLSAKGKESIISTLKDFGISEDEWPRTPKGALSLGGKVLLELTKETEAQEIGEALAELMGQRSLSQLTIDSMKEDGKVHPSINSLQRSGRSCIPETHKLLTRRGLVHVDDIRPGEDETIDMRGNWTVVQEVHRYRNADVNRYESDTVFLEATEEHRWVQWSETGATRTVETLKPRARLQLTPDAYPFDPFEMNLWSHMTERERRAALVGFLITDGHAANRTDSNTGRGRFIVYQTENKFYLKIKEFLGDLVTSDYARPVRNHPENVIHEMRLKTFEVEAILEEEGLDFQGGLRNSSSLFPWVLGLSRSETEAFLTAVYISDGNVRGGTPTISNLNPNKVEPIQVAAYRMGRRSNYRVYENQTNYQVQGRHSLTRDRVSTRKLPEPETFTADVWCVTTESGTFTAWYPEGRWYGPYLTGNSTTKPGLTVWTARGVGSVEKSYYIPDEGCKLVAFDYSNADARAVAAYSCDKEYRKNFLPGVDNHMNVARQVYGDEAVEGDPKGYRNLAKALSHAWNYGGGAKTISRASGRSMEEAQHFVAQMNKAFPDVVKWRNRMADLGERQGFIKNKWGRRMPVVRDQAYTQSSALLGQSGTREVKGDALLKLLDRDPRLIQWLKAQIHDELLFSIPESELSWAVPTIRDLMYYEWDGVEFHADNGEPADNWERAGH